MKDGREKLGERTHSSDTRIRRFLCRVTTADVRSGFISAREGEAECWSCRPKLVEEMYWETGGDTAIGKPAPERFDGVVTLGRRHEREEWDRCQKDGEAEAESRKKFSKSYGS